MPLTISHAAFALPLRRLRLPLSALIMGSMAPDFEFFLRLSDQRVIGHTLPGLVLFCLPVGLGCLLLFHRLLKYPLLSLLPHAHQVRLLPAARRFSFFPAPRLAAIFAALLLGAASHLLLDALTHDDSRIAQRLTLLSAPLVTVGGRSLKLCDLLQHLGSAGGLLLLARAYRRWYRAAPRPGSAPLALPPRSRHARRAVAGGLGGFACLGGLAWGLLVHPPRTDLGVAQAFIATTAVSAVSAFLAAWLLYSLLWHTLAHRRE